MESHKNQLIAQASSLSILPAWYPFFAKSMHARSSFLQVRKVFHYYGGIKPKIPLQILFPITDWILGTSLNEIRKEWRREPYLSERLLAGFMTGAFTALISNPYEKALTHSKIKDLYQGTFQTAIRNGNFVMNLVVVTPAIDETLQAQFPSSNKIYKIAITILAALAPALLHTCVTTPFEFRVILNNSHLSPDLVIKKVYQVYGLAALKTGFGYRLVASTIEIGGFNLFKKFYNEKFK